MLASIRLTLQSHLDTLVEFSPGVNYIIGRSRSGKTVLLRGLRKVLENRPVVGLERWVHNKTPQTLQVAVTDVDGHEVNWKGGNPQTYTVNGEELSGFGQTVPQAVKDMLRLDDINMPGPHGQHSLPFLLFDTPGEVARTLNRVVHLDVIDRSLANIASEKRRNDREVQVAQARLSELQERAAAFPDLEAADEYLTMLEGYEREIVEKGKKARGLTALQGELDRVRSGLEWARVPDQVEEAVDWLLAVQAELEEKMTRLARLRRLQAELAGLRAGLAALAPGLAQEAWVSELLTKNNHLQAKRKQLARLQSLNEQVAEARRAVSAKGPIIIAMEVEMVRMLPPECSKCPLFVEGVKR